MRKAEEVAMRVSRMAVRWGWAAVLTALASGGLVACGGKYPTGVKFPPTSTTAAPAAEKVSVPGTSSMNIELREFRIGSPTTTVSPGQVTFEIGNEGTVQHELLLFKSDLDPSKYPHDTDGSIQEDGAGISKVSDGDNINVGGSQTRLVDLTAPGRYLLVCNLPGHFKSGMFTPLIVEPSPGSNSVDLSEFSVNVANSVKPGKASFTITNKGTVPHELLVFHTGLKPSEFPLGSDGEVNEDAPGLNKISDGDNLDPTRAQVRTIDLSEPGTYVFLCNLPGHFKSGMYATVTVG
jgi:uncharacterized cupredoxin-like copper-binding protein